MHALAMAVAAASATEALPARVVTAEAMPRVKLLPPTPLVVIPHDAYLESKGIDLKVAPISILDQDFESQEDMARGYALKNARKEENLPDWTKHILYHPNPSALQPQKLIGFVYDFLIHANWKAKHIANVLRDMYQDPAFNWTQDFFRYPAEEKANFWARTYSAVALWNTGRLSV